jgi:hypothetical protein
MEERQPGRSLIGRGVIIVLPAIIIIMLVFIMFPTRYYYKVKDGELNLMVGKLGWIDSQRSKALDPIYVGNADFSDLTKQSFETENEALSAISSVIASGIEEEREKLYPLEKQLADSYRHLLGYLRAAQRIGLQHDPAEAQEAQAWLDRYNARITTQQRRETSAKPATQVERSADEAATKPAMQAAGKDV